MRRTLVGDRPRRELRISRLRSKTMVRVGGGNEGVGARAGRRCD
jgi:hypothetical protein